VVRGFGKQRREDAIETVRLALDETPGFIKAEATGQLPKVVMAHFDSDDAMVDFLRSQTENEAFGKGRDGLNASRFFLLYRFS
jgi:heme-degrading monooxygenase HmoA